MPITLTDEQAQKVRDRLALGDRAIPIAEGATRLWNHKELGNDAKALWKKAFPEDEIQGFDTEQRVVAELAKLRQELAEEKKKNEEKAQDDDLASRRKALKDKRGYSDEDVEKLEKTMVERGISHHEDAADLMAARSPAPSEGDASYDRHFWRHDQAPQYKEIASDPEGYGRREILKTLREMQAKYPGYR